MLNLFYNLLEETERNIARLGQLLPTKVFVFNLE